MRASAGGLFVSQSAKLLDCRLDRLHLLDQRVHRVLFEVLLLSEQQDLHRFFAGNYDHAVVVHGDNVTGVDSDSVAYHSDLGACKAVVADSRRRRDSGCECPDSKPIELR